MMADVRLSRIYEWIVGGSGPEEIAVVLVTGSRNWGGDPADIGRRLRWFCRKHPHTDRILLVGDCPGWRSVDRIAYDAARDAGFITRMFRANWSTLGKAAGPARNRRMVELAALFASGGSVVEVDAWPMPDSRGTIHCIQEARRAGLHVVVHEVVAVLDGWVGEVEGPHP